MTEDQFNQARDNGQVNFNQPQPQQQLPEPAPDELEGFRAVLSVIRRPRRHLTTAPTFTPKSLIDQIQFYDDGTNRRMYFYVNKVWRYTALT
jgi:hypothetical protein